MPCQAWIRRTYSGARRRVLRVLGIREGMIEEDGMTQTRFINPQALGKPPGYTHVVEVTGPVRIVYIAGQLGVDREGRVAGDIRAQAEQTFKNLKAALAAVGADFHDVVKFNNYLVDRAHLPTFREVRDRYLPADNRPASTTIAISGLALIEIEAVAALSPAAQSKATSRSATRPASKARAARSAKPPSRGRRK